MGFTEIPGVVAQAQIHGAERGALANRTRAHAPPPSHGTQPVHLAVPTQPEPGQRRLTFPRQ